MKKADVKIGGKYYANVAGKRTEIQIDAEKPRGGWEATNAVQRYFAKSSGRGRSQICKNGARAVHPNCSNTSAKPACDLHATTRFVWNRAVSKLPLLGEGEL